MKAKIIQPNQNISVQMVYKFCHDVQSDLNVIQGFSRMFIEEQGLTENVRIDLERISWAAARLRSKVQTISTVARIESGSLSSIDRSLLRGNDIAGITMDALKNFYLSVGERRGIAFEVKRSNTFDDYGCFADRSLVEYVIWEIVQNAFQFSSQGSTIYARFASAKANMIIEVRNKGLALKAEDIKNVAKRGWRSASAVLCSANGSGIGLWISTEITKSLGAKIIMKPTDRNGYTSAQLILPKQLPI